MKAFPQFELSGSKALITGGSKGIGLDIALTLARAGADLILSGRNKADLEFAKKEIKNIGRECFTIVADLSNEKEIESLAKESLLTIPCGLFMRESLTKPVFITHLLFLI